MKVNEFVNNLRTWLFYEKLKRQKLQSLAEIKTDIAYLEKVKSVRTSDIEITGLRAALAKEQSAENKKQERITEIAYQIASLEDTKRKYENMKRIADDMSLYVDALNLWQSRLFKKN